MSISVTIDIDKAKYLEPYLREAVRMALVNASMRIQELVTSDETLTPVDTGRLRRSFRAVVLPSGIRLSWGTDYARYPDAGVPPHFMAPVEKKVMKWPTAGGWAYSKGHMHPGQPPQNYSTLAGIEAMRILKEELFKALFTTKVMVS